MNRVVIAAVAVVVLLVAVIFALRRETETVTETSEPPSPLSKIDTDEVTKVVLRHRVGKGDERTEQSVTLVRTEGEGDDAVWALAEPVSYKANQGSVKTLIKRLGSLELTGVASKRATSHEELEVDEEGGIFVQVYAGDSRVASFVIGKYLSGHTMIRLADSETVWRASGSLRYVFGKDASDWRDKQVLDLEREAVVHIEFHNDNGHFVFDWRTPEAAPEEAGEADAGAEEAEPDWAIASVDAVAPPEEEEDEEEEEEEEEAPPEPEKTVRVTTIEDFEPAKVRSLVTSFARLRCTDFVDETEGLETGLEGDEPSRVVVRLGSGDDAESYTLLIGAEADKRSVYARRTDGDQVYLISKSLAERLRPAVGDFQKRPPRPAKTAGGPAKTDAKIPPDVMRAAQQEIERQALLKQLMSKGAGQ